LAEYVHETAIDRAEPSDHAIAVGSILRQREIVGLVPHESTQLLEGAVIEQNLQPFTSRQLSLLVLASDSLRPAAPSSLFASRLEVGSACVEVTHAAGKAMLWKRGRRCTLAPIPHFGGIGEGHSRIAVDIDLVLQEYLLRNHFGCFGPGPYRL